MPRTAKKPPLTLVRNNAPQSIQGAADVATSITIMPLQEGIFAWILEEPTRPFTR